MFPTVRRNTSYVSHLQDTLDDITQRSRILRATARQLCTQKSSLESQLDHAMKEELAHCSDFEREELAVRASQARTLLASVSVSVADAREPGQVEAFKKASEVVAALEVAVENSLVNGSLPPVEDIQSHLNATSAEPAGLSVDELFESLVLGCTLDDQKALRERLSLLRRRADAVAIVVRSMREDMRMPSLEHSPAAMDVDVTAPKPPSAKALLKAAKKAGKRNAKGAALVQHLKTHPKPPEAEAAAQTAGDDEPARVQSSVPSSSPSRRSSTSGSSVTAQVPAKTATVAPTKTQPASSAAATSAEDAGTPLNDGGDTRDDVRDIASSHSLQQLRAHHVVGEEAAAAANLWHAIHGISSDSQTSTGTGNPAAAAAEDESKGAASWTIPVVVRGGPAQQQQQQQSSVSEPHEIPVIIRGGSPSALLGGGKKGAASASQQQMEEEGEGSIAERPLLRQLERPAPAANSTGSSTMSNAEKFARRRAKAAAAAEAEAVAAGKWAAAAAAEKGEQEARRKAGETAATAKSAAAARAVAAMAQQQAEGASGDSMESESEETTGGETSDGGSGGSEWYRRYITPSLLQRIQLGGPISPQEYAAVQAVQAAQAGRSNSKAAAAARARAQQQRAQQQLLELQRQRAAAEAQARHQQEQRQQQAALQAMLRAAAAEDASARIPRTKARHATVAREVPTLEDLLGHAYAGMGGIDSPQLVRPLSAVPAPKAAYGGAGRPSTAPQWGQGYAAQQPSGFFYPTQQGQYAPPMFGW